MEMPHKIMHKREETKSHTTFKLSPTGMYELWCRLWDRLPLSNFQPKSLNNVVSDYLDHQKHQPTDDLSILSIEEIAERNEERAEQD